MNPLMSKALGLDETTSDVVPVVANLPRKCFRSRMVQDRQREDEQDYVRRVVGEAAEEASVFPEKTEELDPNDFTVLPKKMAPIRDVVQEPSYPGGEDEMRMTPYAALTAPDATPEALTPIDPSKVPGSTSQTFTAAELDQAEPVESEEGEEVEQNSGVDKATQTMDLLLGRQRGSPAKRREEFDKAGEVVSESQAYSALRIESPDQLEAGAKFSEVGLGQGVPMPEPKPGDATKILEAFRKYC